jgi:hypothetical protein
MGLLPFFTDEDEENMDLEAPVEIATLNGDNDEPYREYELDPITGKLTGRIIEGTDAIVVWCILTLKSKRYEYPIYSWEYGEEFSSMIGSSYEPDLLQSEVKRMLEECLLINEHIEEIADLKVEQDEDKLHVSFTLITDQGDAEVETDV